MRIIEISSCWECPHRTIISERKTRFACSLLYDKKTYRFPEMALLLAEEIASIPERCPLKKAPERGKV